MASKVIWTQGGYTFTLKNNSLINLNGDAYVLSDKSVLVANPIEMDEYEIAGWQDYLLSHQIKQPFGQMWENVHKISKIKKDRYDKMYIPAYLVYQKDDEGIHFKQDDSVRYITVDDMNIDNFTDSFQYREDEGLYLGKLSIQSITRKNNHVLALLDMWCLKSQIIENATLREDIVATLTLQQVLELIDFANKYNSDISLHILLDYKNEKFPNVDLIKQFTLD